MLLSAENRVAPPAMHARTDGDHSDVLIVGRDPTRRKLFRYALEGAGHQVVEADSVARVAITIGRRGVCAIVIHVSHAGEIGEFIDTARRHLALHRLPLLAIADRGLEPAALVGVGAHEMVWSDCPPREIVMRLKRLVGASRTLEIGPVRLNTSNGEVRCAGRLCALSPREFDILRVLMLNAGMTLRRAQIVDLVWNGQPCTARAVDVSVRRIRAALGEEGSAWIETLRLVGYRFVSDTLSRAPAP